MEEYGILINEKHTKRMRNPYYRKVDNKIRLELLTRVNEKNHTLKEASSDLGINYSTAKTIIRIWRMEDRVLRKYDGSHKIKKLKGRLSKKLKIFHIISNQKPNLSEKSSENIEKSQITRTPEENIYNSQSFEKNLFSIHNSEFSISKVYKKFYKNLQIQNFNFSIFYQKEAKGNKISSNEEVFLKALEINSNSNIYSDQIRDNASKFINFPQHNPFLGQNMINPFYNSINQYLTGGMLTANEYYYRLFPSYFNAGILVLNSRSFISQRRCVNDFIDSNY